MASSTSAMVPITPQTSAALGLPSTWSSSGGETPLLDLSFLTREEIEKLERVLREDEQIRTRDRIRLGTLRQDIEQGRSHQKAIAKLRSKCTCCEIYFGKIFNTGAVCLQCGNRVCKQCRKIPYIQPPKFMCIICAKQKVLELQSRDYDPIPSGTASYKPGEQDTTECKVEVTTPALYGSELVKRSLKTGRRSKTSLSISFQFPDSSHTPAGHTSLSSTPPTETDVQYPNSVASSTSYASSIVVRYEEKNEVRSSPTTGTDRTLHTAVARKASADEVLFSDEESEEESGELEGQAAVPVIGQLKHSDSMGSLGSMTSVYSTLGSKGDYDITGEVLISIWHKDKQLFVRIVKAKELAAAKKGVTSDPYIKTYLLPDRSKQTKRKTSIQRKTVNPVYDEILKNKLEAEKISGQTLWLSVWDWDRFGRNQFLGEVRLPLSTLDLTDSSEHWHSLQDKNDGVNEDDFYKGKLHLSLKIEPSIDFKGKKRKGVVTLHIKIHGAQELPKMNYLGLADATVKLYLLPNRSSSGKRKTRVIENSLDPVWQEEFKYEFLTRKELASERVLEVTVWDFDRRGSNDFIGGLRIGPAPGRSAKPKEWMDSIAEEVTHWESVLSSPGEWVEAWYTLRPTMTPICKQGSPLPSRRTGLSPVKELSPTQEQEVEESTPAIVEGLAFTPPASPWRKSDTTTKDIPSGGDKVGIVFRNDFEPASKLENKPEKHVPVQAAEYAPVISETSPSHVISDPVEHTSAEEPAEYKAPFLTTSATSAHPAANLNNFGSQLSLFSETGGKGDYDITGEVLLGVHYKGGELLVSVHKAKGLAAADKSGFSDPYVKTYLLPDKSKKSKKKTAIKKKTLDPVYNEILKYKVPQPELVNHTLWLSVWDWDRLGRNQFLGEVHLPLSTRDLTDSSEHWHSLQDKDESSEVNTFNQGEIKLGIMFEFDQTSDKKGNLQISVKQARDLPSTDANRATNPYVKMYLLPNRKSSTKKKTAIINNNLNPVWGERFSYEGIMLDELSHARVLEVTVWDHDKGSNDFIGGLRLGPAPSRAIKHKEWMDSIGEEVTHWESVLSSPGEWVEVWHTLRSSMDPRYIDLSITPLNLHSTINSIDTQSPLPTDAVLCSEPALSNPHTAVTSIDTQCPVPDPALSSLSESATPSPPPLEDEFNVSSMHQRTVITEPSPESVPKPKGQYNTDITEPSPESVPKPKGQYNTDITEPSPESVPKPKGQYNTVITEPSPESVPKPKGQYNTDITEPSPESVPKPKGQYNTVITEPSPESVPKPKGQYHTVITEPSPWSIVNPKEQRLEDQSPEALEDTGREGGSSSKPLSHSTPEPSIALGDISHDTYYLQEMEEPLGPKPKAHALLQRSGGLLGHTDSLSSFGSQYSVYSAAGGKGDYDITGEVLLGVHYKGGELLVSVHKAKGLAAADKSGLSDPYVKTYLLPDKSKKSKKKTAIKKKTLNPVYNETLKYKVPQPELVNQTLWLSVWDWDRLGRNQFLGEVHLPLSTRDLTDSSEHWHSLQDKDEGGGASYNGELLLSMMFCPSESGKSKKTKGTLNISIKQARDLPRMQSSGTVNAFVKCYLLPDKSNSGKRKTGVIKNNLNPVWGTTFSYEKVSVENLSTERVLEIVLWDFNKGESSELIGCLRLGPAPGRASKHKKWMDSIGEEVTHWESVLSSPGEWVEVWHTLRTSMDYRSVSL